MAKQLTALMTLVLEILNYDSWTSEADLARRLGSKRGLWSIVSALEERGLIAIWSNFQGRFVYRRLGDEADKAECRRRHAILLLARRVHGNLTLIERQARRARWEAEHPEEAAAERVAIETQRAAWRAQDAAREAEMAARKERYAARIQIRLLKHALENMSETRH